MQEHHPHFPILAIVAISSSLLPVISGGMQWKNLSRPMRTLFALFCFYIPFLAFQLWLLFNGRENLWTGNIYSLLEFIIFAIVFTQWNTDTILKKAIRLTVIVITVFWVVAKFSVEPITGDATYTSPVETIVLIAITIFTLLELSRANPETLFRNSKFWVSVGVVLYGAGTLPLFLVFNKILALPLEVYAKIWSINWVLITVTNLLYSTAFFCPPGNREVPEHDVAKMN